MIHWIWLIWMLPILLIGIDIGMCWCKYWLMKDIRTLEKRIKAFE
jgi:hypothetical protein